MCDPTFFAAMAFGGNVLQAAGSLYKGFAGSRAGELSAMVARGNTEILLKNAATEKLKGEYALEKGAFEASRLQTHVERIVGGQGAHFAANNLDPASGSPLLLAAFTSAQGDVDAGLIKARAAFEHADSEAREASLYGRAAASKFDEVASLEKATASLVSGYFGAGSAMLSAVSKWPGLSSSGGTSSGSSWDSSNPFLLNQPTDI